MADALGVPELTDAQLDEVDSEIERRINEGMTRAEAEQDYIDYTNKEAERVRRQEEFYDDPERVRKANEAMDEFNRIWQSQNWNK